MPQDPEYPHAGFNLPRSTDDPWVAVQYTELGLGDAPSLADIEPHALLMFQQGKVLEALSLVMGQTVDLERVRRDELLRGAALLAMQEPRQAFSVLLLKLTRDELQEEQL